MITWLFQPPKLTDLPDLTIDDQNVWPVGEDETSRLPVAGITLTT